MLVRLQREVVPVDHRAQPTRQLGAREPGEHGQVATGAQRRPGAAEQDRAGPGVGGGTEHGLVEVLDQGQVDGRAVQPDGGHAVRGAVGQRVQRALPVRLRHDHAPGNSF